MVIMSLEPSYMSGSHWVACFEKPERTLNYFDLFDMPKFQEYEGRVR